MFWVRSTVQHLLNFCTKGWAKSLDRLLLDDENSEISASIAYQKLSQVNPFIRKLHILLFLDNYILRNQIFFSQGNEVIFIRYIFIKI